MKNILGYVLFTAMLFFIAGCNGSGRPGKSVSDSGFFESEIKGEITVSVYDSMLYKTFLEEAARIFEEKFPGAKVNIEAFSAMPEIKTIEVDGQFISVMESSDNSQARNDYINRVNTKIMSGEGADIYALDILPLIKLINSGSLENLDSYMTLDPEFNKADYSQNIIEALRFRGGIWLMPLNYSFNYYKYDSVLIPSHNAQDFGSDKAFSTEELLRFGLPFFDGSSMLFNYTGGYSSMFRQLSYENFRSFVNMDTGRANFIGGGYAELLESVNRYSDLGYIGKDEISRADITDINELLQRMAETSSQRVFFKLDNSYLLINLFIRDIAQWMNTGFSGSFVPVIEDDDKIAGIQANADGTVPFSYNFGFGINSFSKNKETAWALIKFLLSDEMQMSPNIFNFPVNNKARNEKHEFDFRMFLGIAEGELNSRQLQAMENYISAAESLSGQINNYVIEDANINNMIMQEALNFFNGTRSATETTRILQNKADLYLSE